MSKKHLFIIGGAALLGWLMVDTLSTYPGFSQVADAANSAA